MKRRAFNTMGLAAAIALRPCLPLARQAAPSGISHQAAAIDDRRLIAWHGGMARSDLEVGDDALFQVASCSKTVASLAALTLVRDGRLALRAPVNRHLSRWRLPGPRGDKATVAELMSHTAGTTVYGFGGYGLSEDRPDLLAILSGRAPANSGAIRATRRLFGKFRYSGGGTTVLQALIEDVTGEAFAAYASRAVLKPVGATAATFAITPDAAFAHGSHEEGRPVEGGFRRHPESAAAGLWATASDLARILRAILGSLQQERGALLPVELAARMVTPVSRRSGLGVYVGPGGLIWHDGRNVGFDAVMAADLATGRVRAAVANRNGAIETDARALLPA